MHSRLSNANRLRMLQGGSTPPRLQRLISQERSQRKREDSWCSIPCHVVEWCAGVVDLYLVPCACVAGQSFVSSCGEGCPQTAAGGRGDGGCSAGCQRARTHGNLIGRSRCAGTWQAVGSFSWDTVAYASTVLCCTYVNRDSYFLYLDKDAGIAGVAFMT